MKFKLTCIKCLVFFDYEIITIINVFRKMEVRDKRRWGLADENGDGSLTKNEFKHFLHPEEVDHMKELVVQETIDDIDKVRTKIMKPTLNVSFTILPLVGLVNYITEY